MVCGCGAPVNVDGYLKCKWFVDVGSPVNVDVYLKCKWFVDVVLLYM